MSDADVIVAGAGTAGGLVAEVLARRGLRVVILEAGPRIERWTLVERFRNGTDRGDFMQPYPGVTHAPQGLGSESDYIVQNGPDPYLSQYVRAVGGTTWHWAAACWRFLPNDFRLRSLYGVGRDWPIGYDDLERHYQAAEAAMGVAGPSPEEENLGSPRSADYPMPRLPASPAVRPNKPEQVRWGMRKERPGRWGWGDCLPGQVSLRPREGRPRRKSGPARRRVAGAGRDHAGLRL